MYAWYTLIGTAGTALGIMTCGWATDVVYRQTELDLAGVYRLIFYAYTILGLVKALLVGLLTPTVDRVAQPPAPASSNNAATETDPLLGNEGEQETTEPLAGNDGRNSWLPQFTEQSLSLLLTLCLLFGLDSFASGLAPLYVAAGSSVLWHLPTTNWL